MHRFFYRDLFTGRRLEPTAALLLMFSAGALPGALLASTVPDLCNLCQSLAQAESGLFSQILCGLLPLVCAGVLALVCKAPFLLLLPAFPCGFLFSFTASVVLAGTPAGGFLFAALLLMDRGVSLAWLFWFLLRRVEHGQRELTRHLMIACLLTMLTIFVFSRLLSPSIQEVSRLVFTST